ncbi:hypothetical protein C8N47_10692 [Mangrovibacterium marinum]|uniref:Uncharacterized protein n=1 Tax=Mangrovibacterium marinum TaxID=1639118 RepID=A0A2T5C2M8_9BACT|nr:hypothetical protein C8N47_10692 [Mangrovibacterium marinum]
MDSFIGIFCFTILQHLLNRIGFQSFTKTNVIQE